MASDDLATRVLNASRFRAATVSGHSFRSPAQAFEERQIGLPAWRATREPGRISAEILVTDAALGLDPAEMAALFGSAIESSAG